MTTPKKLTGWYFHLFFFTILFISGMRIFYDGWIHNWSYKWPDFWFSTTMMGFSLFGLFASITTPLVNIIGQKIYFYSSPFPKASYVLMIDDIKHIGLLKGCLSWKIIIQLRSGKVINYSPSPLETDLRRVVTFINKIKRV